MNMKISDVTAVRPTEDSTLGVERKKMPQVKADKYPELFQYLKTKGGDLKKGSIDAKKLLPTQKDFDAEKVKGMMANGIDHDQKPLLVSDDNYIIDGHHRWLAAVNLDEDIPIVKIGFPVKELLDLVRNFKHTTFTESFHEGGET